MIIINGSLEIVNLFAHIETDSNKLYARTEFIGSQNNHYLKSAVESADTIIVAWGSDKEFKTRKREVWDRFLSNRTVYYFEDDSNRRPPVHISRLANGFYLKAYTPSF